MASRSIEGLARGSPRHRHPCQLLDSSATSVLGTVRRLGYLQLDPISTVAPATAPRRFWDFRYRIEMYVPKAKREHDYYVLPLLVGDQLVGRAEPLFDRKTRTLRLHGAWGDTSRLPRRSNIVARRVLGAESISS